MSATNVRAFVPPSADALSDALSRGDAVAVRKARIACLEEERDHYRQRFDQLKADVLDAYEAWRPDGYAALFVGLARRLRTES